MISHYAVFMVIIYLIVSGVSDANIDNCNPINISRTELQRLTKLQYDVYKRCEVSQGQSIDVLVADAFTSYKCRTYFYESDVISEDNVYINKLTIPNINETSMSDMWECQITSEHGNRITIHFEINIKGVKPSQLIFVNRVALSTEAIFYGGYKASHKRLYEAQYNYQIGEKVDIACINLDSNCTGDMTYKSAKEYLYKGYTSSWDVGFQKELQREDNYMRINCNSKCFNYEFDVTVTFRDVLKTNRYMNVFINNQKVQGTRHLNSFEYYINYAYFITDQYINIECDASAHSNVQLHSSCKNCEYQGDTVGAQRSTISITPHQLSKIIFFVTRNNVLLEQIVIFFTQISSNVPTIYTTKAGPSFSLTSPVTSTMSSVPPVLLLLTTPLSPIIRSTTTLPTTPSTLTASHESEHPDNYLLMTLKILGIVVIIVLIGVFVVIYKMKIKYCRKKRFNNNDDNVSNEDAIPSSPPQWNSEYAAPKDMIQSQTIYAEPYTPVKDPNESCQYAILDLKEPTSGYSRSINDNQKGSTSTYSQVLQKSLREKTIYGNRTSEEPNYATIITESDPIEPTYNNSCVMNNK